jgi:hypothetical protein
VSLQLEEGFLLFIGVDGRIEDSHFHGELLDDVLPLLGHGFEGVLLLQEKTIVLVVPELHVPDAAAHLH